MESGEARLVSGVDVDPEVDEAGDGGQGAGLLLVGGFDGEMKSGHSISVPQFLVCSSMKQERNRLVFEPAHGDDEDNGDGNHVVDACVLLSGSDDDDGNNDSDDIACVLHTEEQTSPPSARQHCPPLSVGIRRLVWLSSDGDNGF